MHIYKEAKQSWLSVFSMTRTYWRLYGGWAALLSSPYLHVSILVTLLSFNAWTQPEWWSLAIGISPTIIGFSLAGLAVFFGMGEGGFQNIIAYRADDEETSPFIDIVVALVHFIVWQLLSLIFAITAKSLNFVWVDAPSWFKAALPFITPVGWGIGYVLFVYSILLVLATTFSLLRAARWFEEYVTDKENKEP